MVSLLGPWSASAVPAQDVSEPTPSSRPTIVYDLVKRPNGDPSSIVRVQLTCIFPSGER